MHFNKKILTVTGLLAGVIFMASMTTIQQQVPAQQGPPQQGGPQQPRPIPKLVNIKAFPKSITYQELDHHMEEWAKALGVRCNFCHAMNPETKKMDFSLDTKPEKLMARKMFAMESKINKKFFGASKDSLGIMKETGITCNTCHRGNSHPKVVYANIPGARPAGAPGAGPAGFGGPGGPGGAPRPAPTTPPSTTPTNR